MVVSVCKKKEQEKTNRCFSQRRNGYKSYGIFYWYRYLLSDIALDKMHSLVRGGEWGQTYTID